MSSALMAASRTRFFASSGGVRTTGASILPAACIVASPSAAALSALDSAVAALLRRNRYTYVEVAFTSLIAAA